MTGYIRTIKTLAVNSVQQTFDINYPEPDPDGGQQPSYVSVEFPVEKAHYPGIWVDYEDAMLQAIAINHIELNADMQPLTRWKFQGHTTFTIVSFSSNERDMIYDELIAQIAFAAQSDAPSTFRQYIENNALVNTTWSYDVIESRGNSAGPGTPWGSNEWVYERTFALQVTGDFATDPATGSLVPLKEIIITGTPEDGPGPFTLTIE